MGYHDNDPFVLNRRALNIVKYHDEPNKLPEPSRTFCITKEMDIVPRNLRVRVVISKVPLSYAICEKFQLSLVESNVYNRVNGSS